MLPSVTVRSSPTTIAGCSSLNPLAEDEPETYSQDDKQAMLFEEAQDDWPDDLTRDDSLNEHFDRSFANQDEAVIVMMHVDIYKDISTAKDEMEKSRASASNDEDYPIAGDGFITDDGEAAQVFFRDQNAKGQTLAIRASGVARARIGVERRSMRIGSLSTGEKTPDLPRPPPKPTPPPPVLRSLHFSQNPRARIAVHTSSPSTPRGASSL